MKLKNVLWVLVIFCFYTLDGFTNDAFLTKLNCDLNENQEQKEKVVFDQIKYVSEQVLVQVEKQGLLEHLTPEKQHFYKLFKTLSQEVLEPYSPEIFQEKYQYFWENLLDFLALLYPPTKESMLIKLDTDRSQAPKETFAVFKKRFISIMKNNVKKGRYYVPSYVDKPENDPNRFSHLKKWGGVGLAPIQIIFHNELLGHMSIPGHLDPLSMIFHDQVHDLNFDVITGGEGRNKINKENCELFQQCLESLSSDPDKIGGLYLFYAFHEIVAAPWKGSLPQLVTSEAASTFLGDFAADFKTKDFIEKNRADLIKICQHEEIGRFTDELHAISKKSRVYASLATAKICRYVGVTSREKQSDLSYRDMILLAEGLGVKYNQALGDMMDKVRDSMGKIALKIPKVASCNTLLNRVPEVDPICFSDPTLPKNINRLKIRDPAFANEKILDKLSTDKLLKKMEPISRDLKTDILLRLQDE